MDHVTKHPDNHFSWIDLASTDFATSRKFYADLFGWDSQDDPIPGMEGATYTTFTMNGLSVAGGAQMQPEQAASGHPSYWQSYINTEDIEARHKMAVAAGAETIMPPSEIPPAGHICIIKTPGGEFVGMWQAGGHIGAQLVNVPGAFVWNELATRDPGTAQKFYHEAFGWEYQTDENNYTMITNNGRMNGGMVVMNENFPPEMPPHWSVYFMVENCHEAVEKAVSLGATIMMPPTTMGGMDFSGVKSPSGEAFYLIRSDNVDPMP